MGHVNGKLIRCGRCGQMVVMLIFAPGAVDAAGFEDCARLMYPKYAEANLPTWIIGPEMDGGPEMERPSDILKVWPTREPLRRLSPVEFNPILARLRAGHCG